MKKLTLHDDGHTRWVMLGRDPQKKSSVIDTNEYLIVSGEQAMLLDPGGIEIFPQVLTGISEILPIEKITAYLASHQDPDIMSSLPLWLGLTPQAKIYMSWLWGGFISHFGNDFAANFKLLPDEGETLLLGGREFLFIPAHHLHSAGNFHFFDPEAKILFSGDVGSALVQEDYPCFVEDFGQHTKFMETFHARWMPSNEAKNNWINRVRKLKPKMICPQHGSIFREDSVEDFLDWFEDLEVGRLKKYAA